MKFRMLEGAVLVAAVLASAPALPVPISTYGSYDTFTADADLADGNTNPDTVSPNGESDELAWVKAVTGDTTLTFGQKFQQSSPGGVVWGAQAIDEGGFAIYLQGYTPKYFLFKLGGRPSHYLFTNNASTGWAAVDYDFGDRFNLGKISHISIFGTATDPERPPTTPVPETTSLALLALGLIGVGLTTRRRRA